MASVLAVDLGNENCVIALPRRGGVDIILNQSSQRLSPSMVAFDNDRRYAAEFARTQQMQNVVGTITNLKRLIGLQWSDPERVVVQDLITAPLVEMSDGFIGIRLSYNDSEQIFRVEQLVSLLLLEVFKIARSHGALTNDCVVVISPWWGEVQRRALLDAASICGFKVLKLLNSTTAAAITYSMYHRTRLPTEAAASVPVAFIDFGDSSMNVAIAQLFQGSVEIKAFSCDRHLGGSHFTTALLNFLLDKVLTTYRLDVRRNKRAMLRFRTAVEKTKKILSINPVARFEVQSLMNDIDVIIDVKREDFEALIVDLVERIAAPVEEALKLAGVQKSSLFAIEVHGGASRVAIVKNKIAQIFGKEPTQSLNPDECFAMGGAFQAAILSPQYNVNLAVKDVSPHSIFYSYTDSDHAEVRKELFKQFNVVPSTKRIKVKVTRKLMVTLSSDVDEIGYVYIDTESDEEKEVKLEVRLTPDSLIDIKGAYFSIVEEVEEKTIEKKVAVKYDFKTKAGLENGMINQFQTLEKEMAKKDEAEEKLDVTKNELETYIFRMMNALNRDFPEYFDPSKKNDYINKVNEVQEWFSENEFDRLPLREYETKLSELRVFGEPATKKRELRSSLKGVIGGLKKSCEEMKDRLASKDERFNHITEEEREGVRSQINSFISWLDKKEDDVEKTSKHLEVPFKATEAENRLNDLDLKTQRLLCKPKPIPPKPKEEEKPKEAPAESTEQKPEGTEEKTEEPAAEERTEEATPEGTEGEVTREEETISEEKIETASE